MHGESETVSRKNAWQKNVEKWNRNADCVMPRSVQAKQGVIHHVREPRQGEPVIRIEGRECPPKAVPGKCLANIRVVGHVRRVIEIDEAKPGGGKVGDASGHQESKAD